MPRSSKSFLFPDVNVWIALSYDGHVHHKAAQEWFATLDDHDILCFCRITQISFLRLLTTAAILGPDVLTQTSAWDTYDTWMETRRVLFLEEPQVWKARFVEWRRPRGLLGRTGPTRTWQLHLFPACAWSHLIAAF